MQTAPTTHIAYYLTRDGQIAKEALNFVTTSDLTGTATYKTLAIIGKGHVVKIECYTADFRPAPGVALDHPVLSPASPIRIGEVYSWMVGGDLKACAKATAIAGGTMDTPLPIIEGDLDAEIIESDDDLMDSYAAITAKPFFPDAYRGHCDAYHAIRAPYLERAAKLADKAHCHVIVLDPRGEIHCLTAPTA